MSDGKIVAHSALRCASGADVKVWGVISETGSPFISIGIFRFGKHASRRKRGVTGGWLTPTMARQIALWLNQSADAVDSEAARLRTLERNQMREVQS